MKDETKNSSSPLSCDSGPMEPSPKARIGNGSLGPRSDNDAWSNCVLHLDKCDKATEEPKMVDKDGLSVNHEGNSNERQPKKYVGVESSGISNDVEKGKKDAVPEETKKNLSDESNSDDSLHLHWSGSSSEDEESQPIRGFARGLDAEKILGATDDPELTKDPGSHSFLIKWKGCEAADLVSAKEANVRCPQLVIKYYEENSFFSDF